MQIVSSYAPFPSVGWWQMTAGAEALILDGHEHFGKMSERNRYRICGANNSILLSIPLVKGREQRTAMKDILIANSYNWQVQHWRTITSVYNRSPFFAHYEPSLYKLYSQQYDMLTDFCLDSLKWCFTHLNLSMALEHTSQYQHSYPGSTDLRTLKKFEAAATPYYQVFQDRIGFIPGLSILDLLFSEGPAAQTWIHRNAVKG